MTHSLEDTNDTLASLASAAEASVLRLSAGCRAAATATAWSETHAVTAARALGHDDEVRVARADGTHAKARVVGRDPATDLALLEVEGGGLSPAAFADDTSDVRLGHLVLALGRPGRATRASLRMIGVVAQDVPTDAGATLERYLETDRGVPSGFEGGPVLDLRGRVLGIQSVAAKRGADLIVPAETIRRAVDELLAHGKVRTGYLGVGVRPIRLPQAARDALGRRRGALVMGVADDSPAMQAGLHLGDVIVELDGEPIGGGRELARALRDRFDDPVTLKLWRTGALVEVEATPEQRG
jgi:S1-C subfamily serine protease